MTLTELDIIIWSYDSNSTFRPSKMVKLILFCRIHKPAFPKPQPIKNFWICGHNVLIRRCKFDKWLHLRLTDRAVVTAAEHSYACIRVRYVVQYISKALQKSLFSMLFLWKTQFITSHNGFCLNCIIIMTIWLNPYHRNEYFLFDSTIR